MRVSSCSRRLLAAIAALGPVAGFAQTYGFTGVFAPENWTLTSGGTPASVVWNDDYTSFTLTGSDTQSNAPSFTYFTVNVTSAYIVAFDWIYETGDDPQYDYAGYITDGSPTPLSSGNGDNFQSGSTGASPISFSGGAVGFYVQSVDNLYGPASLTVSNFSFSENTLPPTPWPSSYNLNTNVTISNGASVVLAAADKAARSLTLNNHSQLSIENGGRLTLSRSDSFVDVNSGSTLTVTGAGSALNLPSGYFRITTGTALFDQGASVFTSSADLGFYENDVATLDLRNGATWGSDEIYVGYYGQATINIEGGAQLETDEISIGYYMDARGTVNVSGAGSTLIVTDELKIGSFGAGALNISDGAHVYSYSTNIGSGSAGGPGATVGTVYITGAGSRWEITQPDLGIGTYVDENLYSFGTLTIADGAVVKVGENGDGTVNIHRGGILKIGDGGLTGTLQAKDIYFETRSAVAADAPDAILAFDHSNNITFALPIDGLGIVTKAGTGMLTLSGDNTYSGGTIVTGGTLRAIANANALGSGSLTLAGGDLVLANNTGLNFGRPTTITADTTITTDRGSTNGIGVTHFLGSLSIGAHTLSIAAGPRVTSGTAGLTIGPTTLTADGAVFDTGAGTVLTLGTLSGNYSFSKEGAGQLNLGSSSNRSSGTTTLADGILRLFHANALGNNQRALHLDGGDLQLANNSASTFNGTNVVLRGDATVTSDRGSINGAGVTHTLGSLSLGSHTLSIARGSVVTSGTAGVRFGATTLTGSPTLSVASGAALTLGAFDDGGVARTLVKSGAGTLTLGNAATRIVDGTAVELQAGTLQLNHANGLGSLAMVTLSPGATLALGTGSSPTLGALQGTGGTVTLGSNTLTIGHADSNRSSSFGGVISGNGGLAKAGSGTLTLAGNNTYAGGTVVHGGTLVAGHVSAFGGGVIVVHHGATLDLGGFDIANTLDIRGGVLTGLTSYSGTQTVVGETSYSGVVGGELVVTSGGAINTTGATFTGPVMVESGGTLAGTGTLASVTVAAGGTLSPGNSPGLLTIETDLIFADGSFTVLEIAGPGRGVGYDAIDVGGTLFAGGTLNIVFIDGYTPGGSAIFDFFNFTSFGGSFAQIHLPVIGGYTWNTSQLHIDGTIELIASAIPEPSSAVALAALAAGALATTRRRRVT